MSGTLASRFKEPLEMVGAHLPDLITVVFIAVAGFLLAYLSSRLIRVLVRGGLTQLDRMDWFKTPGGDMGFYRRAPEVAGRLVFWTFLLITAMAVLDMFDLPEVSSWARTLVSFVPNLLAGVLLIFLGFVGGDVARFLITRAASRTGLQHAQGLSRTIQVLIILVGVTLGIEQLGVTSNILTVTIAILAATSLGGAGLAFGLGARGTVANILGMQQVQGIFKVGDQIKVGDTSGSILELTQTSVILETQQGRINIPGQVFSEQASTWVDPT